MILSLIILNFILDGLGVAGEVEVTQNVSVGVVLDPAQLLKGELLHPDLDVVLGVQARSWLSPQMPRLINRRATA